MRRAQWIGWLILFASVQGLWAAGPYKTVKREFSSKNIKSLDIRTTNGRIVFSAWSKDSVLVVAHIKTQKEIFTFGWIKNKTEKNSKSLAKTEVEISGDQNKRLLSAIQVVTLIKGHTLNVFAKLPREQKHGLLGWLFGAKNYRVDWDIKLPASLPIKASSTNGDIEVDDMAATLDLSTVNGGIMALRLQGPVMLNSTNGTIHVFFKHLPQSGFVKLSTINGKIELCLPGDAQGTISAYSTNGAIDCQLMDLEYVKRKQRTFKARIRGGGVKIELQTTNGDITILNKDVSFNHHK